MNTKEQYLAYVQSVLDGLDPKECKASYDGGYGLYITNEHLGESPMTILAHMTCVAKVKPPEISDFDEWNDAWQSGKKMVRLFLGEAE